MKYLWVRLSLAFSGVILLSVILVVISAFLLLRISGRPMPPVTPFSPPESEPTQSDQTRERERQQRDLAFLSRDLLLLAAIGGTVALVAGIWMSRSLANPLNQLAEAARSIGTGDLSRRVSVKGTQEMVEVATAFNQMASDLEKSAELRRNLMTDVAHELRTPLTVLQGNLRAIIDDVYVMDKEEVARLYDQTRHLTQLVEDLRIVAQAEAHQLPLDLVETNIFPLLKEVYAGFEPIALEMGVELKLDLADSTLIAQTDAARMQQVVHNLLSNALRHTPPGGRITLQGKASQDGIMIAVADTGEGIPPEHLPHVFDRFYRADPARARDSGGTGLGLAIVKAIVETHNGRVSVASSGTGEGAVFTIWLPKFRKTSSESA